MIKQNLCTFNNAMSICTYPTNTKIILHPSKRHFLPLFIAIIEEIYDKY